MSRFHAEMVPEPGGGWRVFDRDSTNGTLVNGAQVPPGGTVLAAGDTVEVGSTLLLFRDVLDPPPQDAPVPGFAGVSDAARAVRSAIARAAPTAAPVVVLGETGTGKELVASALGALGRPGRPFVAFNASAMPAALVEAALFGHERGAFTDARQARHGMFRSANGGTLFLDEVGDLSPDTQVKLLRVLEEGRVQPIGATAPIPVDVRVVSATNRDLLAEVAEGRFRSDLYARLSWVVVRIPPLRERVEDVAPLAQALAGGRAFTMPAMRALLAHPWPFNVRELRAVVHQMGLESGAGCLELGPQVAARLAEHRRLFEGTLPSHPHAGVPEAERPAPGSLDREAIEGALARHGGNMTRAAEELGRDRSHLYRMLRRLGIDPEVFRPGGGGA
jgi:DNA-binding NtrC family response regulator